jgi:hypothetical protein
MPCILKNIFAKLYCNIILSTQENWNAFHFAARRGHASVLRILLYCAPRLSIAPTQLKSIINAKSKVASSYSIYRAAFALHIVVSGWMDPFDDGMCTGP